MANRVSGSYCCGIAELGPVKGKDMKEVLREVTDQMMMSLKMIYYFTDACDTNLAEYNGARQAYKEMLRLGLVKGESIQDVKNGNSNHDISMYIVYPDAEALSSFRRLDPMGLWPKKEKKVPTEKKETEVSQEASPFHLAATRPGSWGSSRRYVRKAERIVEQNRAENVSSDLEVGDRVRVIATKYSRFQHEQLGTVVVRFPPKSYTHHFYHVTVQLDVNGQNYYYNYEDLEKIND